MEREDRSDHHGELFDIGSTAVPLLQEAEIEQPEMADRLVSLLEEIRGGSLEDELTQLAALPDGPMDLEQGALLIAAVCLSFPDRHLVYATAR